MMKYDLIESAKDELLDLECAFMRLDEEKMKENANTMYYLVQAGKYLKSGDYNMAEIEKLIEETGCGTPLTAVAKKLEMEKYIETVATAVIVNQYPRRKVGA